MSELKRYKITLYNDGVKTERSVLAHNKEEATEIGWELFDADSIYVSEVADNDR